MNLAPLRDASPVIQFHAAAALAAFASGALQFLLPKGTRRHRVLGAVWVALMLGVAGSSLFIHELRLWGRWSPIHLLSLYTLAMVPLAVWQAHAHRVEEHRRAMRGLFLGALVIAGLFTLAPGRILHAVLVGA